MLRRVELPDCIRKMPSQLSGGQRKRVGLARALILEPQLVLYDEPTAGLDPPTARGVCDLIRRMRDELAVTEIVVTHEMEYAFHVADRVAMLHGGRIRVAGSPDELRASTDPVVRGFLGSWSR
jgi:phospholipid/cholesterol/gamma-HCH transport system ATP-binding protein